MHSSYAQQSGQNNMAEASHFQKLQSVDLLLTYDQYIMIQHHLPKKYALIETKNIKKGVVMTSAVKLGPQDVNLSQQQIQNQSYLSGPNNSAEIQGRTKRIRIKKNDKFFQQQPKIRKPSIPQQATQDQFTQCRNILVLLQKNRSAFPFQQPVDPIRDGVPNYSQIIKQPMDLSTIQSNLNNGVYRSASQFHAHINKIWTNSYTFNQKGSLVHKLTGDMQKYYKNLLNIQGTKKTVKNEKTKGRPDKGGMKQQQVRDERKKSQYLSNNGEFIYES